MGWCRPHHVSDFENVTQTLDSDTNITVSSNSWCEPFKTWQYSYSFDPVANLTASEAKLVKGGV